VCYVLLPATDFDCTSFNTALTNSRNGKPVSSLFTILTKSFHAIESDLFGCPAHTQENKSQASA